MLYCLNQALAGLALKYLFSIKTIRYVHYEEADKSTHKATTKGICILLMTHRNKLKKMKYIIFAPFKIPHQPQQNL